jgi:hypothetical protein
MIISQKQLLMLYQILIDSLPIVGGSSPFKYDRETRERLANAIINQQSDKAKTVE